MAQGKKTFLFQLLFWNGDLELFKWKFGKQNETEHKKSSEKKDFHDFFDI